MTQLVKQNGSVGKPNARRALRMSATARTMRVSASPKPKDESEARMLQLRKEAEDCMNKIEHLLTSITYICEERRLNKLAKGR